MTEHVASFHLASGLGAPAVRQMAQVPIFRHGLAATPGLVFGRYLGTARAETTRSADPDRWAVFAVWEDEGALDAWSADSTLMNRWRSKADDVYSVRLAPLTAHGRWGTAELFPGIAATHGDDGGGPIAVLTRARVRIPRIRRFSQASARVDTVLARAPGRLASVGFGEWPFGWQGTFSIWKSRTALTDFAYAGPEHAEVVRRTRAENWYGEELFARFRPYSQSGTWSGTDPLSVS